MWAVTSSITCFLSFRRSTMASGAGDHAAEIHILGYVDVDDRALVEGDRRWPVGRLTHGLIGQVLDGLGGVAFEWGLGHQAIADGGIARSVFGGFVLEGIAEQTDQQG